MSQRLRRSKKRRQENVVVAATGGQASVGDAASREVTQAPSVPQNSGQDQQVSPPSIPSSKEGELTTSTNKDPGSDEALRELQSQVDQQTPKKATAAEKQEEEKEVSDEKNEQAPQGLAKASPRFQELKPKAEASEEDKEKALRDNKVDEVDLNEG